VCAVEGAWLLSNAFVVLLQDEQNPRRVATQRLISLSLSPPFVPFSKLYKARTQCNAYLPPYLDLMTSPSNIGRAARSSFDMGRRRRRRKEKKRSGSHDRDVTEKRYLFFNS
jgi:hypothetical protein